MDGWHLRRSSPSPRGSEVPRDGIGTLPETRGHRSKSSGSVIPSVTLPSGLLIDRPGHVEGDGRIHATGIRRRRGIAHERIHERNAARRVAHDVTAGREDHIGAVGETLLHGAADRHAHRGVQAALQEQRRQFGCDECVVACGQLRQGEDWTGGAIFSASSSRMPWYMGGTPFMERSSMARSGSSEQTTARCINLVARLSRETSSRCRRRAPQHCRRATRRPARALPH